jgi:hypothetical protein
MNDFFIPPFYSLNLLSAHALIGVPIVATVAVGMSWLATTQRHAEAERAAALARQHEARAESGGPGLGSIFTIRLPRLPAPVAERIGELSALRAR